MLCQNCILQYYNSDIQLILLHKSLNYFYHINLFIYDDLCRKSLIKAKFKHSYPDVKVFISAAIMFMKKILPRSSSEREKIYVCHVPGIRSRIIERRFDLVYYTGHQLSSCFNLAFKPKLIERVKTTQAQKTLSKAARQKNVKGAFKISQCLKGKHIIVVDDIYTSGSTLSHTSQILLSAGAESVYALSLAIRP